MIELYVEIFSSNDTDTTLERNVVQYLYDNSYTILEQVQQFPYFDTVDEFIVTTEEVNVTDSPTPTAIITTLAPVGIPLPTLAPVLVNLPTRTPMVLVPTGGSGGSTPSKDNNGSNGISSTGIAFLIILIIVIIVVIFYLRYHHNKKQERVCGC